MILHRVSRFAFVCLFLSIRLPLVVSAQEPVKPGPEHAMLKSLEGQ
jgi:hypothetical protein